MDTEEDLSRVEDLLFEIDKNLKTLENQTKKAERYYKLKEKYKILSLVLAPFNIVDLRTSLNELDKQEEDQIQRKHNLAIKIDDLDALNQKYKFNNLAKEKNLSTQQKSY